MHVNLGLLQGPSEEAMHRPMFPREMAETLFNLHSVSVTAPSEPSQHNFQR